MAYFPKKMAEWSKVREFRTVFTKKRKASREWGCLLIARGASDFKTRAVLGGWAVFSVFGGCGGLAAEHYLAVEADKAVFWDKNQVGKTVI